MKKTQETKISLKCEYDKRPSYKMGVVSEMVDFPKLYFSKLMKIN